MRLAMTSFALLLFPALCAAAAIPSPPNSSFSPCLITDPDGTIPFVVTVRDIANNPVPGATVQLTTCDCPEVRYCPLDGTENYTVVGGCTVTGITDANGQLVIGIKSGGVCLGTIELRADGVLLNTYGAVASTDQDADSFVTPADRAILIANAGSSDPRYDLDCSPPVTADDVVVLNRHLYHGCDGPVPVVPGTWGRIKSFCR